MTPTTADPRPNHGQGSEPTHPQDTGPRLLGPALRAINGGLKVFPAYPVNEGVCTCPEGRDCRNPGKHDLVPNGAMDATNDKLTIVDWWTRWPYASIRVATGVASDFVVLDPDRRHEGADSLDALIARYGSVPDRPEPRFRVRTFLAWARQVDAASDPGWIAEPVWPGDAYGVLAAESKAGKTWAQLDLAISVATGTKWMNAYPTTQGTVVVFLGEGGERNTIRRIRAILKGRGLTEDDLGDRLRLCFRVPHLTDNEHIAEMERVLADIGDVRLVILDPLYLAAGGANGASLYDMAVPLEAAQHVAQEAGAALVIVHHFNQTGTGGDARRMSGAGPEEWGRVLATVTVPTTNVTDDGRTETAYLAWSFTGSEIVPTALGVKRTISVEDLYDLTSPMTYEIEPTDITAKKSGNAQTVLDVLNDHGGWLTTDEVAQRVSSLGKRAVQSTLKALHDDEQIERDGVKATGYSYRLPTPPATGGAQ